MGVWVYGCMGVWVYGCMGVWVYGCMGVTGMTHTSAFIQSITNFVGNDKNSFHFLHISKRQSLPILIEILTKYPYYGYSTGNSTCCYFNGLTDNEALVFVWRQYLT